MRYLAETSISPAMDGRVWERGNGSIETVLNEIGVLSSHNPEHLGEEEDTSEGLAMSGINPAA